MNTYDRWKLADPHDTPENARYSDLCSDYGWDTEGYDDVIKAGEVLGRFVFVAAFGQHVWMWLVEGYREAYDDLESELCNNWPVDNDECQAESYLELKRSYPW